jgi:hypothetical protein
MGGPPGGGWDRMKRKSTTPITVATTARKIQNPGHPPR